jgi:hypothetical protein
MRSERRCALCGPPGLGLQAQEEGREAGTKAGQLGGVRGPEAASSDRAGRGPGRRLRATSRPRRGQRPRPGEGLPLLATRGLSAGLGQRAACTLDPRSSATQ